MTQCFEGRIFSLCGGDYTIKTAQGGFVCRARGRFRREGISPLVGDLVLVEAQGDGSGFIAEVLPRKNALTRPPLANLDQLFLICSTVEPRVNLRLLDLLIAAAELSGIEPVPVFTKADLCDGAALAARYRASGFTSFSLSSESEAGIDELRALFRDKLSAFCGNSGAGKSTLLNRLAPGLSLSTGEISQKLGRGRHTTRQVSLFDVAGGLVADTPGFSALDIAAQGALTAENLPFAFREFLPFLGECRFSTCSHTKDKGCRILQAMAEGAIPASRHASYAALLEELKAQKQR
ncbi:MAG: ribosome small subunit-dependent GTPase A [Oscillospiraceae bacterium]|jgi:ribosome biogenesis GTPase|nr:ribosome small subunit-dependent GTPase A [Oscillospiraceae bacterium]